VAKILSRARQLRLNHQAKMGRPVTLQEVADAIGIERAALNRIELGQTKKIEFETLLKLCAYYEVGVGEILEYDPNMQEASYTEGVLVPA
jgi:DNA-binding Xre family transcriptional regulator